jgi:hypothetical protein
METQDSYQFLSDIWVLSLIPQSARATTTTTAADSPPMTWKKVETVALPSGRCSHSAIIFQRPATVITEDMNHNYSHSLLVLGGFEEGGIASEALISQMSGSLFNIPPPMTIEGREVEFSPWEIHSLEATLGQRFGQSFCSISTGFLEILLRNTRYQPILRRFQEESAEKLQSYLPQEDPSNRSLCCGGLLFGGVNIEKDFADLWLIMP